MEKEIKVAPWLEPTLVADLDIEKATGKISFFLKSFRKASKLLPYLKVYPKPISKKEHPKPYEYYKKLLTLAGIVVNEDFIIYHFEGVNLWRVPFSSTRNEVKEVVLILDILDYPTYNKIFGYK